MKIYKTQYAQIQLIFNIKFVQKPKIHSQINILKKTHMRVVQQILNKLNFIIY